MPRNSEAEYSLDKREVDISKLSVATNLVYRELLLLKNHAVLYQDVLDLLLDEPIYYRPAMHQVLDI